MIAVALRLVMAIVYNVWIFIIYIMSMTLTTFWAQDIFDELIQIKLQRIMAEEEGGDKKSRRIKNPSKTLQKM